MSTPIPGERTPTSAAWLPIIAAGLGTSALTLLLVWAIGDELNLMGLYLLFILPAGAILVGLGAGSGYGLLSWKTGTRIGAPLMAVVLALQLLVYFLAQYLQYRGEAAELVAEGLGFWTYFDLMTRSFAFEEGDPLGGAGYVFRLLEVLGFAVGGALAPFFLRSKPYCQRCQRYMRTKQLTQIPASVPAPGRWRKSQVAKDSHSEADQEAWAAALGSLGQLQQSAAEGDLSALQSKLFDLAERKKEASKVPIRIVLRLVGCTTCGDGYLQAQTHAGQGENVAISELAATGAAPELVKSLL